MPYVPQPFMNRVRQAILAQERMIREDKEWWVRLNKLADANDVVGFYAAYVEYLTQAHAISDRRNLLIRMARAVVEQGDVVAKLKDDIEILYGRP